MTRTCYAPADTSRAIIALVAPFAFLAVFALTLTGKGYSISDYLALIRNGEVAWLPQLVGWLSFSAWVVRYFPSAWTALWDGPCVVSGDASDLFLPGGHKVSRACIRAVTVQRTFLRKVAYFEGEQERIAVSLLFVRASADPLLRSLGAASGVKT
jgi:hypothetical protein